LAEAPDNRSQTLNSAYAALLFTALRFTALLLAALLTGPVGRALDRLARFAGLGERAAAMSAFNAFF
jgi:hypothetical protein